ncbi:hypothetical protein SDC9_195657 [bioreactor metagenome]|uniref:Uncharacterized protein n=1 Tax=bioreactor metagenome TaxID=1076179 RepID=A0A645IL49_9ZZZZ
MQCDFVLRRPGGGAGEAHRGGRGRGALSQVNGQPVRRVAAASKAAVAERAPPGPVCHDESRPYQLKGLSHRAAHRCVRRGCHRRVHGGGHGHFSKVLEWRTAGFHGSFAGLVPRTLRRPQKGGRRTAGGSKGLRLPSGHAGLCRDRGRRRRHARQRHCRAGAVQYKLGYLRLGGRRV